MSIKIQILIINLTISIFFNKLKIIGKKLYFHVVTKYFVFIVTDVVVKKVKGVLRAKLDNNLSILVYNFPPLIMFVFL